MYEKWIYRLREDKVFPLSDTPVDQFKEIREADQRVFIDFAKNIIAPSCGAFPASADDNVEQIQPFWISNAVAITCSPEEHLRLQQHQKVLRVHQDIEYKLPASEVLCEDTATVANAGAQRLWNLELLQVNEFCERHGLSGKGIRVGILDTGVDGEHPELSSKLKAYALVEDEREPREVVPGQEPQGMRHGTHVAGIIVSDRYGIAVGAELYVASVLNGAGGSSSWSKINKGLQWLISKNVDVINLSLGGGISQEQDDLDETFHTCVAKGIALIAAIGNVPPGSTQYPGNSPYTFSVGATTIDDLLRPRSGSSRNLPKVVAPGENIISTIPDGNGILSGTSQAAPHITALFALLKEACPSASSDDILDAISGTATHIPRVPVAHQGQGLISYENSYLHLLARTNYGNCP